MLLDYHIHPYYWLAAIPVLYAEIHFRIRGLFSRYDMQEPEIIADVPHRIDPGRPLLVLLIIKDADRFPVSLQQLRVTLEHNKTTSELLNLTPSAEHIDSPLWSRIYNIHLPEEVVSPVKINVMVTYTCSGKIKTIVNDNYRLTSHKPFRVHIDTQPLPRHSGWYFGDLHYHSNYSCDQVEFGATLEDTVAIARTMGLDFFAATDHSYDLDDYSDDYLHNDPELAKWHEFRTRINSINSSEPSFIIIPGEELSAGNATGHNVHFLLLNSGNFFPGCGDGAEIWFKTRPEMTISEVLQKLEADTLAIAAHPEDYPPFVQRLLINRDKWRDKDYRQKGLHGVQMWNGRKEHFLRYGLPKWISLLLEGRRLTLYAGNDAHGNFNRFRQLSTPFVTMREHNQELFALARTGVYMEETLNPENLVRALRGGRVIVTDGPFAEFSLADSNGNVAYPGNDYMQESGTVRISAASTPNFGELVKLEVFTGDCIAEKETCLLSLQPEPGCFEFTIAKELHEFPHRGYLRLVAISQAGKQYFHCFTNPLYLVRD